MKGFTLLELLITITIVMTVGLLSASFYASFFSQNAVANTVDQLVGELRKAQVYAMMGKQRTNCTGSPCNWGVDYAGNIITLYLGNSFVNRNTAFDEKFSVSSNITISGLTDLNFARMTGLPNVTPTITITGNNSAKSISINSQGVVSRN